jgi:tRNA threonylcarbamoyladenosine biosynthesis protein TsaB
MAGAGTDFRVLAIETSGDLCSVAVTSDFRLLAELVFRHEFHLSERLMANISAVLRAAGMEKEQIDAYAVGLGPGSYTGVRIGVMTAKTLADVTGKPLYGVCSLQAMVDVRHVVDLAITMLPCRADLFYSALYEGAPAECPTELMAPGVFTAPELAEAVLSKTWQVKPRFTLLHPDWSGAMASAVKLKNLGIDVDRVDEVCPRAAVVADVAYRRRLIGLPADDPIELAPLYLAPPNISKPKTPIPGVDGGP